MVTMSAGPGDDVRDAVGIALINSAEIGMERFVEADAPDEVVGVRIDRLFRDVLIPRIVVGQEPLAAEAGGGAELDRAVALAALHLGDAPWQRDDGHEEDTEGEKATLAW